MLTQQIYFMSFEARSTISFALFLGDSTGKKGKGRRDGQNGEFPFSICFLLVLQNIKRQL